MREEEFDKIIKQQVDKQIQAPEELKNRIVNAIQHLPERERALVEAKFFQDKIFCHVLSI